MQFLEVLSSFELHYYFFFWNHQLQKSNIKTIFANYQKRQPLKLTPKLKFKPYKTCCHVRFRKTGSLYQIKDF